MIYNVLWFLDYNLLINIYEMSKNELDRERKIRVRGKLEMRIIFIKW